MSTMHLFVLQGKRRGQESVEVNFNDLPSYLQSFTWSGAYGTKYP